MPLSPIPRSPSPLSVEKAKGLPNFKTRKVDWAKDGKLAAISTGALQGVVHDDLFPLPLKVDMINAFAHSIDSIPPETPLTFVSLASDYLLITDWVVRQMPPARRENTQLRIIDPIYAEPESTADAAEIEHYELGLAACRQLRENWPDLEVKTFPTVNAYLTEPLKSGRLLFNEDKQGAIACWLNSSETMDEDFPSDELIGKGLKDEEVRKANAILIHVAGKDATGEQERESVLKTIDDPNMGCGTENILRCHPHKDGVRYTYTEGFPYPSFAEKIDESYGKIRPQRPPIEELHRSAQAAAEAFNAHDDRGLKAIVKPFSDLELSKEELIEKGMEARALVIARLERGTGQVGALKPWTGPEENDRKRKGGDGSPERKKSRSD